MLPALPLVALVAVTVTVKVEGDIDGEDDVAFIIPEFPPQLTSPSKSTRVMAAKASRNRSCFLSDFLLPSPAPSTTDTISA